MLKLNDLADIIKLIYMVKNRPRLYSNNNYSWDSNQRPSLDILWEEIAEELNVTPEDCKRKWNSLRNAYSRDLRNEKLNNRKKWYLADHLDFLRDHQHNRLSFQSKLKRSSFQAEDSITQDFDVSMDTDQNKSFFDFSFQDKPKVNDTHKDKRKENDSEKDKPKENETKKEIEEEDDDIVEIIYDGKDFPAPMGSITMPTPSPVASPSPRFSTTPTTLPQASAMTVPTPPSAAIYRAPFTATPTAPLHTLPMQLSSTPQHNTISLPPSHSVTNGFEQPNPSSLYASETQDSFQMNEANNIHLTNSRRSRVEDPSTLDDRNMAFFKSLIPDILTLSDKGQRLYKQNVLMKLNALLDQELISC